TVPPRYAREPRSRTRTRSREDVTNHDSRGLAAGEPLRRQHDPFAGPERRVSREHEHAVAAVVEVDEHLIAAALRDALAGGGAYDGAARRPEQRAGAVTAEQEPADERSGDGAAGRVAFGAPDD